MSQISRNETEVKEAKSDVDTAQSINKDAAVQLDEPKANNDEEPAIEPQVHQLQTPIAFNVVSAPKVCPPGYRMDATGKCRKIM